MRLIAIWLIFSLGVSAQTTFNRILYPGLGLEGSDNVVELADGYLIGGEGNLQSLDGWTGIVLVKTDLNGNPLWRKEHGRKGYVWNNGNPGCMITSLQGGVAMAGYFVDSNSANWDAALYKFDDDGDLEWMKIFGGASEDYFSMCKQMPNGDYIMIGYTENFGGGVHGSYYVVKTDSLGNLKWQKTYGGANVDVGVCLEIGHDNFVFGGGTKSYGQEPYSNYIIKTDTSGSVVWTALSNVQGNRCGLGAIKRTPDEGYVTGSCADSLQNLDWLVSYIQKLDDTGEVVWRYYFEGQLGLPNTFQGSNQIYWQIMVTESDDIVVVGEENYSMDSSYQYGWIVKLNKNGIKKWERLHAYRHESSHTIYDVKETADKGFICTGNGFEQGYSNSSFWLLKLDSLGCLSQSDCGLIIQVTEPVVADRNIIVQIIPNPIPEKAIITIKAITAMNEVVTIYLHDITGRIVFTNTINLNSYGYGELLLNRNNVAKGAYLLSIKSNGALVATRKILFQ